MDDEVRSAVGEGAVYIGELAKVVVHGLGDEDLGSSGLTELPNQRGAQKARSACDHNPAAVPEGDFLVRN